MRKLFRLLLYLLGGAVLLIALLLIYVKTMLPSVGDAPELHVDRSAANVERGRYLATHVMVCMDCHSTRNWDLFSGPPAAGTLGEGGETFDRRFGFPGSYVSSNITPYNLGTWTDGEIFRAITTGVAKDGRALFSIMPSHNFGQLDKRDIEAVIAYIRSIAPIENHPKKSVADFPMNFIINTLPQKANLSIAPEKSDTLNYGKYLVTAAGCMDCHTKQEQGKFVGQPFAGGFEFKFPNGSVVRSSNLTPDKKTGLGNWTREQFVAYFKLYEDSAYAARTVAPGGFQTFMPWTMYAGMVPDDIVAIYTYLRSLKPVEHSITRFSPARNELPSAP